MKTTILSALFFIISLTPLLAQDNTENLVIIRMQIQRVDRGNAIESMIHITESDGSIRIIELEKFNRKNLTGSEDALKKIHFELKGYLAKGYTIISHTKGFDSGNMMFEDYILHQK